MPHARIDLSQRSTTSQNKRHDEFLLGLNKVQNNLALVAHAVTQAIGGMELEDGTRPGGRLNRLHAHCGVCTSPTVMLTPSGG